MPWQLTNPVETGDLDSGTYAEVKITSHQWLDSVDRLTFGWEYGNTSGGIFQPGVSGHASYPERSATISGSELDTLKTHVSNDGELTWDANARCLYEWLSTNSKIPPGSVV
jgi:hypothetical protein